MFFVGTLNIVCFSCIVEDGFSCVVVELPAEQKPCRNNHMKTFKFNVVVPAA